MADPTTPPSSPRSFNFLLATRVMESFGDSLARTVMPIIAVSLLGLGTTYVGILNSLGLATFLLFGMPIGMYVDQMRSRHRAMTTATLTRAAVIGLLIVLYLTNTLSPAVLLGSALLIGVADVFFTTAETTIIPRVVQPGDLRPAYSRLAAGGQSASTAASLSASLMLTMLGLPALLWSALAAYMGSILTQRGIKLAPPHTPSPPRQQRKLADGLRTLRSLPALWALTCSAVLTNAGVMLGNTLLPVFILRDLSLAAALFAAMGVVSAIGSILGSAFAPRLSKVVGLRELRVSAALLSGLSVLLAVFCEVLPGSPLIWLGLQAFSWNFLVSLSSVSGAEVLPRSVPQETLASVAAAQRTLTLGVMPIAALLGGIAASYTGTHLMLCVWAGLAALASLPLLKATSLDQFN